MNDKIKEYENSNDADTRFYAKNYALADLNTNEFAFKGQLVPKDKYIFKITEAINQADEIKLYMIGFNQGPALANTDNGIKPQITQGNISQYTDDSTIMYSIPALQGSSGSPILNQYGELIAINFAGLSSTQSFNYGIRVDKLHEIVNNKAINL